MRSQRGSRPLTGLYHTSQEAFRPASTSLYIFKKADWSSWLMLPTSESGTFVMMFVRSRILRAAGGVAFAAGAVCHLAASRQNRGFPGRLMNRSR